MTDHATNRRIQRQRESRRAERQHERHVANATLRDAVRAIGAGDAIDWPQDMPSEPLEGVQDARTGVGQWVTAQKGRKAAGARKSGGWK